MYAVILQTVYERVIFSKCSANYYQYRIPGILAVGDSLLLTCEARAGNYGDWGDIDVLVLRMEEGSAPREVLKIGESSLPPDARMRTYHNPVLIPDELRVHLIYHVNYEQAFIVTSEDEGRTWGKHREITSCFHSFPFRWNVCASGPGHGVQMNSGRLVVPIWLADGEMSADGLSREHMPSVAGCIFSDDHGKTWHAGALAGGISNGNETSLAVLPDGKLLFNIRNMNRDHYRVLGISPDGGASINSLRAEKALQDPWCFGGMAADEQAVLFVNCDSMQKRENVTVKRTPDAGLHWEAIWNVDIPGGYADITYANGAVYVFYERFTDENGIISELVLKKGMKRSKEREGLYR